MANAPTTGGSRTFGNVITIQWNPLPSSTRLVVQVLAGAQLLEVLTFDGNDTQSFNVSQGNTIKVDGTITAVFNADGTSGTLNSESLEWEINGHKGSFMGTIGVW